MNKPRSLLIALNKAVPYIHNHPEKISFSISNGAVVASGTGSASWEYRYTLNLTVEAYDDEEDELMAQILLWLYANQPDAINNPTLRDRLFSFETTPQDSATGEIDLHLHLQLTERILVSVGSGAPMLSESPEPPPAEEMWTVKGHEPRRCPLFHTTRVV